MTRPQPRTPAGNGLESGRFAETRHGEPDVTLSTPGGSRSWNDGAPTDTGAQSVMCPQHGGPWGQDETCEACVNDSGEARPVPQPITGAEMAELDDAQALFAHSGGRGVELADRIDELKTKLNTTMDMWQARGLDDSHRSRWLAGGFDDADALAWIDAGTVTPDEAADWSEHGFDAPAAADWIDHDFYTADDAAEWSGDMPSPAEAADWRGYKFHPDEAADWRAHGIASASDAADWYLADFEPEDAARWATETDMDPASAARWRDHGFTADQAANWDSQGVAPTEAARIRVEVSTR